MKQNRWVNRELLDAWIESNSPEGVAKLALRAKVSTSLINKMRSTLNAPTKQITQDAICKAMHCTVEQLFPIGEIDEGH
jgi:DNA-binding Xre family transcriptional regulator